jgi:protein TonB
VQSSAIGVLLILPMIYMQGLPTVKFLSKVASLPVPAGTQKVASGQRSTVAASNFTGLVLRQPERIPTGVAMVDDHGVAPVPDGIALVEGSTGRGGDPNGVWRSILSSSNRAMPVPPVVRRVPPVSVMMEGLLIHRVEPLYPIPAKAARIEGTVHLQAIISKGGRIERLQVLDGHPMLAGAALEAVRQWRYRPYVLNGEAIEVETQVTVNFVLSRN